MRLLPGIRPLVTAAPVGHQGGWDEVALFFGAPVTLFFLLRWLGVRKERREQREAEQIDETIE